MCDYCGCRRSGPTAELSTEHEQALDPEQCDEIELAHRAIEAVWDEPVEPRESPTTGSA